MSEQNGSNRLFLTISSDLERVEEILHLSIDSSQVQLIKEVSKHILFSGGKRLRPALAILSAKICGYSGESNPYLGAAVEFIHTASLIHDDVLDSAQLRRGVETANSKWGNHISILVGDFFLSLASLILAKHTTREIIALMTMGAKETTEGEVLEVVYSSDISMDEDQYLNIVNNKTACLIAASCEAGSRLAEAPERLAVALREYGMNLGVAFQITDDILDYTAKETGFGKARGTDLKEGKLTLPLIYALKECTPEEKSIIKETLLAPTYSPEHFTLVVNILDKYGCIEKAKEVALSYLEDAEKRLEPFKASIEKDTLIQFTNFIGKREI